MLTGLAFTVAAAACNRDPSVVKLVTPAVSNAVLDGVSGTRNAVVAVTLDDGGNVTAARIFQSSGNAELDAAAVQAARQSTYAAGETQCAPSGGTFGVQFQFVGNGEGLQCPRDASVVLAAQPQVPAFAFPAVDTQVDVIVTIDPAGKPIDAHVTESSGSSVLDRAALSAARNSRYLPKYVAMDTRRQAGAGQRKADDGIVCKPVTGQYVFRVRFRPAGS